MVRRGFSLAKRPRPVIYCLSSMGRAASQLPLSQRSSGRDYLGNSMDSRNPGSVALCLLALSKTNHAFGYCSQGKVHSLFHSDLSGWPPVHDLLQSLRPSPASSWKSRSTASTVGQDRTVSFWWNSCPAAASIKIDETGARLCQAVAADERLTGTRA